MIFSPCTAIEARPLLPRLLAPVARKKSPKDTTRELGVKITPERARGKQQGGHREGL
jgi:hypothetical protein